jgi:site-specific recombinase XerD
MERFLSPPIIGLCLFIIVLAWVLTKLRFRGLKIWKYRQCKNKELTIRIQDGKIIEYEQVTKEILEKPNHNPITEQATDPITEPTVKPVFEVTTPGIPSTTDPIIEPIVKPVSSEVTPTEPITEVSKNKAGRLPAIEKFWDYLDVAGRGKQTIQAYKYDWGWWQKQAKLKGKTTYTLKVSEMEAILKGKDPYTTRRKIAFLRTLSKWYLREGYPKLHEEAWKLTVPKLPKRIPKDKGAEKFEELREKAKQMVAEKNRVGLWIALKLLCGLRISEIQTARVASKETIQVLGKGQKERLVPAPQWILVGMKKIKQNGKAGWRQDRFMIWYHLSRMDLRNPHSLRHTCASQLMRKGLKIEEIKEFLGHENISTTNIYARAVVPTRASQLLDS